MEDEVVSGYRLFNRVLPIPLTREWRRGISTIPLRATHEELLSNCVDRADEGSFELIPGDIVPRDQLWFHSAEVQARVARAEDEFRTGHVTRTVGIEETQRFLDSLKATPADDDPSR